MEVESRDYITMDEILNIKAQDIPTKLSIA